MKPISLQELLEHLGGQVIHGNPDVLVRSVTMDRKKIADGVLLFSKEGRRLNWPAFQAFSSSVVVAVNPPGTPEQWGSVTVVKVADLSEAYWGFVNYYRKLFSLPAFAITGTCGKTSVKEMIKHLLRPDHRVVATLRNQNALSMSLAYLMAIDDSTQVAVFETGVAAYPNDLLNTLRHLQPTIGIMTNIGIDHIEGCGSFENYLKAKAEMLPGLNYEGTLILNCDDENIAKIDLSSYRGKVISFGQGDWADYRAVDIRYGQGGMEFTLRHRKIDYPFFVPGYGTHNVYNALAAIAGVHALGLSLTEIRQRLKRFKHLWGHFSTFKGINGATVIDDTWKSTPISLEAALRALQGMAGDNKKVVVTGRMASELMEHAEAESKRIGRLMVEVGVDVLITRGEEAKWIAEGAIEAGMKPEQVIICTNDFDEVYNRLYPYLHYKTVVLVKSSWSDNSKDLLRRLTAKPDEYL